MSRRTLWLLLATGVGLLLAQWYFGWRGAGLELGLAPVGGTASSGLTRADGWLRDLGRFGRLATENQQLRQELARLRAENASLLSQREENQKLRALAKLEVAVSRQRVTARLCARDPATWQREVMVDKGLAEGVEVGWVALTEAGLVGSVVEVSQHAARVRLVTAGEHAVPVKLAEQGQTGVLYGAGRVCHLKFVNLDQIEAGQAVVTSGLGRFFPGGVLVGHLDHAKQVVPAVDFTRLLEVVLVGAKRP
ncbi:MAG: rod shape-determining protein MreC [Candidatus Eremiobacteraeota bacterium]|nr:rod shape-determining protein MreC [Candidatus Eremiobacteraeota bacterium]